MEGQKRVAAKRKHKLLIVEDCKVLTQAYSSLLSNSYDLSIAHTGASALRRFQRSNDIDLIILDYKLPDLPGDEVLSEFKKRSPAVPVIVITAFGSEEVAVTSFRSGAKDYLRKPFKVPEFLEKIKSCLPNLPQGGALKRADRDESLKDSASCIMLPCSSKVQQAINYIDQNYPVKINVRDVVDLSQMSRFHFSRTFKEATGKTYPAYLNDRRLERAKDLLRIEDMTVTEVAFCVGYSDLTHFERVFKRATGLTPSEYQALHSTGKRKAKKAE